MVKIRQANHNDGERLAHVKPYWGDERAEIIIARRLQQTQEGKGAYLVAEIDDQIVGHVFLKFYGKETAPNYPEVEDLYVQEKFRRQGVGTALMQQCEVIARSNGFNMIGLAAGVDETGHERLLYKKLGYILTGDEPYVDGVYNGVEDWVANMKKELNKGFT